MAQTHRHRPRHPHRGARQDHASTWTTRAQVSEARFHVTEFRGFEKFCEGRPFREMPAITSRICGICPVSHLLASAKAGDAILAVAIPPAAERAAPADEPGADRPVARAQLLPPVLARPAAGL